MGVAADHLGGDRLDHVAKGKQAGLGRHLGVIDGLEEEIAELVLEIVRVAAGDGVGDLIGFLDRVGRDGREVLHDVPGAAGFLVAQRGHDLEQPGDVARWCHGRPPGNDSRRGQSISIVPPSHRVAAGGTTPFGHLRGWIAAGICPYPMPHIKVA